MLAGNAIKQLLETIELRADSVGVFYDLWMHNRVASADCREMNPGGFNNMENRILKINAALTYGSVEERFELMKQLVSTWFCANQTDFFHVFGKECAENLFNLRKKSEHPLIYIETLGAYNRTEIIVCYVCCDTKGRKTLFKITSSNADWINQCYDELRAIIEGPSS